MWYAAYWWLDSFDNKSFLPLDLKISLTKVEVLIDNSRSLTESQKFRFGDCQRAMETAMNTSSFKVSLEIGKAETPRLNWIWVGHISHMHDDRRARFQEW